RAGRHQVVHQVVAARHAVEHAAHQPPLLGPRHAPETEIRLARGLAAAMLSSHRSTNLPSRRRLRAIATDPGRLSRWRARAPSASFARMPELPEVETVRRGLEGPLVGRVLARVEQRRPDLRWPLPERFAERLTGRRVIRLDRRAKFILAHLDDGEVW